jgi:hypothetical protein
VDLTKTCQAAVDAALDAAERSDSPDRLRLVATRLLASRTPYEAAEAEGHNAGRRWAEDIAALSELRHLASIVAQMDAKRAEVLFPHIVVDRIHLECGTVLDDGDIIPDVIVSLPESVPIEWFDRAAEPQDGRSYDNAYAQGFLQGAVSVLHAVEPLLHPAQADARSSSELGHS